MAVAETLAWTRPSFFALRFELVSSTGVVALLRVQGLGPERHVLADTEAGIWRFDLFPLDRTDVPITAVDGADPVAVYGRGNPVEVRFINGQTYRFRPEGQLKTLVEDSTGTLVFSLESVEAFPRWRVEVKPEADILDTATRAILLVSACCYLVFTGTSRDGVAVAEQSSVQGG